MTVALLLALGIVLLAVGGLALGMVFGRGPIKGSCGGMACLKDVACEGCPHRRAEEDRT
ncbi:(Na+)-NQR maturation NqrM [Sedimentimonas flavescens]|uniref:(Na+)-NQR maturation NqrM n=1 Tax=Sedimentimonas flavescens TaxID=2851012 RepID=A0ABT3A0R5_9RHOB|nr:(Na+)-NQR maturation NqrM [Sedimentimonas flavescens]MCV2879593.1 (Na+)-NQR maturation NqrM [Sedimentimonas flavescens]